jgi:hypothetical protein
MQYVTGAGIDQSVYRYDHGLDCRGSIPGKSKSIFSTPQRPDLLWSPASFLFNWYRWFFPLGCGGRGVKLITRLQIVLR